MAGTHGGVLYHNAGVMTGEGFLFGPRVRLPGAEPPSFVGHQHGHSQTSGEHAFVADCILDACRTKACGLQAAAGPHRSPAQPARTDC